MQFIVSSGTRAAKAPDRTFVNCKDLGEALNQACNLLAMGRPNVSIEDAEGRRLSGPDLEACCRAEKVLQDDLTVT